MARRGDADAMLVHSARHPHVRRELSQQFIDWIISAEGRAAIASYRIGGEPLFVPNLGRP